MKKYLAIGIVLVVLGISYVVYLKGTGVAGVSDYLQATYGIDGERMTIGQGGLAYFGNETRGDFNGDGRQDIAFLVTWSGGGSGTFFYVVAALDTPTGYVGTNGILLGDRIAPQSTSFSNGRIVVSYADRKPDEPMTAQPSVGVSKTFAINMDDLVEIQTTADAIAQILAAKYGRPASEVHVTVTKEVMGYAAGSVLFGSGGPGEGGMWLAVLGNGWQVVWDGNGNVNCDQMRTEYGFPDTILKPNFCD